MATADPNSLDRPLRECVAAHQEGSELLFGTKARLISELRDMATECADDDWDGYGAQAVSEAARLRAEAFIRALPEGMAAPEIAPEADGQISFDWLPSRTKTFSLSIDAGNRLACAWIDGANRGHGAEVFEGNVLPIRLLEELLRLTRDGSAHRTA
ncbi:MAG: hypothetical protein JJT96_04770 [Opitutales bacterium]|nr:hypothetical protein [Opitutales bacterium]